MKNVKMVKTQKGITLVALIITIIVLLILAVVAIQSIKNNGIINYAKNARAFHEDGRIKDEETIKYWGNKIEEYATLSDDNGFRWLTSELEDGTLMITGIDIDKVANVTKFGRYNSLKLELGIEDLRIPSQINGKTVSAFNWAIDVIYEGKQRESVAGLNKTVIVVKNIIFPNTIKKEYGKGTTRYNRIEYVNIVHE